MFTSRRRGAVTSRPARPRAALLAPQRLDGPTDDTWRAVSQRDRRLDGCFVYVTLTTNIYCRPSCPARLPHRKHIAILGSASAAEHLGYIACRRCHPSLDSLAPAEQSVQLALAFIRAHGHEPVTLVALARACGLSANHLQRVFTRIVGLSPKTLCDFQRVVRLKELLRSGVPVSVAGYEAGYGSARALYEKSYSGLGMTPARYQRGAAGIGIRCALGGVTLGRALVAETRVGVCTVLLGARDDSLLDDLSREFPGALLSLETRMPSPWVDALRCAQREDPLLLRLPLTTRRDVFQAKVWKILALS